MAAEPAPYVAMLIACVPVACNLITNYFQASGTFLAGASLAIGIVYLLLTQSVSNLSLVCFSYFTFGTANMLKAYPGVNVANFILIVACFKYAMLPNSGEALSVGQSRLWPILTAGVVYFLIRGDCLGTWRKC